jgi:hypothetical protein
MMFAHSQQAVGHFISSSSSYYKIKYCRMSRGYGAGTECVSVSVCLSWGCGTVRLFISPDVFKKSYKVGEKSILTTLSAVARCAKDVI